MRQPHGHPGSCQGGGPTTPTVTNRTLRRSARPDVFWLPWVIGNSHLSALESG